MNNLLTRKQLLDMGVNITATRKEKAWVWSSSPDTDYDEVCETCGKRRKCNTVWDEIEPMCYNCFNKTYTIPFYSFDPDKLAGSMEAEELFERWDGKK